MKCLLLFNVALVSGVLLCGCQKSNPVANTFTFARGADSQKLDPADVDDGESIKVLVNICEGLVRFRPHTTEPEPCLATAWTISDDGLTYTFQLRSGVRFHDGTPLTAETALFSFRRQLNKEVPTATFAYWDSMFNMVTAVEVAGPMELRFRLREPHAPFLASLCIPAASLISPRFQNQNTPVGTGPFRFGEWIPNEKIVLHRNADYWDEPPTLEHLIFRVVPDNANRLIQLQTGQVQGLDGLDPNFLDTIAADPNLQLLTTPGLNVAYLAFHCDKIDLPTRRAIAAAIHKTDLVKAVYRNTGVVANNPLPPFVPGHHDNLPSTALHQAPTPRTTPLRLHVMTNPRPYLPNPLRAAEMIKADCAAAGIPIEIIPNEWGAHLTRTSHGEHELALLGWVGDNGDADNFLYVLLDKDTATLGSAMNITFWKNDAYHDLMLAARRETDPTARAAIYRQAQELIAQERPMVPLAHAQSMIAIRANIAGVLLQPNGDIFFQRARQTDSTGTGTMLKP